MAPKVKLAAESCHGTALNNISFQYFAEKKIQWSGRPLPSLEAKSRNERGSSPL